MNSILFAISLNLNFELENSLFDTNITSSIALK